MRNYGEWVQSLVNCGSYLGGARLYPAPCAIEVRVKNGKSVFTDGPFAETKEQLGDYPYVGYSFGGRNPRNA